MTTKIKTIALIAILSVLQVNAQETRTFLPLFDEETTRFYFAINTGIHPRSNVSIHYSYFDVIKDMENKNTYYLIGGYIRYFMFEISEDNSKLWGLYITWQGDTARNLLMDLNLNVGDTFNGYTVAKVYYEDGRRHIEFEGWLNGAPSVCVAGEFVDISDVPFVFVEGVGPNALVVEPRFSNNEITAYAWLYARHRNGEFEHGIKGAIPPIEYWYQVHPDFPWFNQIFICVKETGIKEPGVRTLSIAPNPARDYVQIILPETTAETVTLTISNLQGQVIETIVIDSNLSSFALDISRYAPAVYIAVIEIGAYRYVGRIIKN